MFKNTKKVFREFTGYMLAAMIGIASTFAFHPVAAEAMTALVVPDNTAEMQTTGSWAHLYIPDVDINVPLYDVSTQGAEGRQGAVDAANSAATFMYGKIRILCDHNTDGFINMTKAENGKTMLYIQRGSEIEQYVCVEKGKGTNATNALLDANGTKFKEREDIDMVAYTCTETWVTVHYTCWRKVEPAEKPQK